MANQVNTTEWPLSNHNLTDAATENTKAPTNYRKLFIGAIVALCLSAISAILGTYLYCYIGLDKHPKDSPIFLVWLIVCYALTYVSATMTYFCYRNLPAKVKKGNHEEGRPLLNLRRNITPQGNMHRRTTSIGSPYPLATFSLRGRTTPQGNDGYVSMSTQPSAVFDELAITATDITKSSPFDCGHPHPLASSPITSPLPAVLAEIKAARRHGLRFAYDRTQKGLTIGNLRKYEGFDQRDNTKKRVTCGAAAIVCDDANELYYLCYGGCFALWGKEGGRIDNGKKPKKEKGEATQYTKRFEYLDPTHEDFVSQTKLKTDPTYPLRAPLMLITAPLPPQIEFAKTAKGAVARSKGTGKRGRKLKTEKGADVKAEDSDAKE
ncbi:hypothetical protein LTR08_007730 [Meristemomyces frigidus]|nr:hypothetical protein LTR08_007730 [Meristemomyces frigidus]